MPYRERSLRVKNRMRVIRSSGSVRGGDGNIPAYSAIGKLDVPPNTIQRDQPIISGITIHLKDARKSSQYPLGI